MLSKCANPQCSTPLLYLREGKVFKLEVNNGEALAGPFLLGKKPVASATKVEHFWLCGPCAQRLTLKYDSATGVSVLPRQRASAMQAAAS